MKGVRGLNSIAYRLRELRQAHGLTQADIAAVLQIDRSTYSKYEKDHSPSIESLNKLALFYNMSLDELAGIKRSGSKLILSSGRRVEDVGELSDDEISLVNIFRCCDRKSEFIMKARILALELNLGEDFSNNENE